MKQLFYLKLIALTAGLALAADTAVKEAAPTPPADAADTAAEPAAEHQGAATIRFANEDRLLGSLESLTQDLLVWDSPVLQKPTPFFRNKVLDISMASPGLPETNADHEALVTLTNGDTVRGQLASVTDEVVSLHTWFAGRMDFNRLMVRSVKIDPLLPLIYRGPVGTDGWVQPGNKTAWTYGRSAFRSSASGSIGRDGLLPEECSVSFDVAWRSDSFNFKLILFSTDPSVENSNSGYELSFQRGSVYLRNNKTSAFLGNAQVREFLENDRLRVEIRASHKSGKICLFINERIAEVWTDQDTTKGEFGQGLQFVAVNTLPLRISDIQVARWDGVVDQTPEPKAAMMRGFGMPGMSDDTPEPTPEKPAEGRMKLANGDSLVGEVNSIQEGVIDIKTPLGEVKLPVSRLRSISLKAVEEERCIRRNGDVRASFPDGSSLVFRLDKLEADSVSGSSQNFGTASFKLSAFDRIEFNIYDPDFEEIRGGDPW